MSEKKIKILEVATKLFAEQGYEKTSVTNICEMAGVSKGLIYHHFKSKEFILTEIFSESTNKMLSLSKQSQPKIEPNIQLVYLIESIFSQLENDKMFFQLNLNIMFQPSTKKILRKQINVRGKILFDSVKNIFDKISSVNSTMHTYIFIAEIDGIVLNYLSVFEDYPLKKIKEQLINKYK
jgi:AcrR family transcriptional regulator